MSETTVAPGPAKRRSLPWWAWLLIVFGALLVVSIPLMGVLGLVAYVQHSLAETSPDQAFIEGPPQQPDAASPLDCSVRCFEPDAATLLAVSADDLSALSITDERNGVGAFEPTTVAEAGAGVGKQWTAVGGDEECAFVPSNAPYFSVGADSSSDDPITFIQTWVTGDEFTDLAARDFATTDAASEFMRDLHARVAACPSQDLDIPTAGGLDTSLIQITPQAAIQVPDDVAAVGWVREGAPGPRWRSYVWDLQRGNLVVQVRVLTDGRISEKQVGTYAEFQAERLAALDTVQR